MGKLQLGKLQHKVSFYRDAIVVNATTGEQEETLYAVKENRWGSVKYIGSPSAGSSEEEINDQRTGKMKIEVQCRFFSGLRFEDWIEFEGGKFRIYSIQTLGRNEGYSLRAELRDDDTDALPTGALMNAFGNLPAVGVVPELSVDNIAGLQDSLDLINDTLTTIDTDITTLENEAAVDLTANDIQTLDHFRYDAPSDKLIADRAIETTLNSLFLGEQHKMSSGAENIFFTNLGTDINFYPMWGGLRDQSLAANQGSYGYIPPSGRVYTDMFSVPLGGNPDPLNSMGYSGPNYFAVNIAGLGITTVAAEQVPADQHLEYRLSVNGKQVYLQKLKDQGIIYAGQQIEWFFDHPVEIHAGTTIFAEIRKVTTATDTDNGIFQVQRGQTPNADGSYRYQAIVHNRLFEDKDLELISPYLKYQAMDFGLDASTSTVFFRDLSLGADNVLTNHPVNTLEAIANGTNIKVKVKNSAKILVESLPVNAVTLDGSYVNSVLSDALVQLNDTFSATTSFRGGGSGSGNPVSAFALSGNSLTITLTDGTSFTQDVTNLVVDENNFVASGSLSGTNLVLTMDDASTVTVDASTLAVDTDTIVTGGTVSGNDLTLTLSDSSTVTVDVTSLNVDTNLYVASGAVNGSNIELTMTDGSVVTVAIGSLQIDNDTTITGGSVVGTDIVLTVSDASTITIDASTIGGSGNPVVSGSVVGTDLVLVLGDATQVTIDATNMVNGSTLSSLDNSWYISHGTNADNFVNISTVDNTVKNQQPFYFGNDISRGEEFRWNVDVSNQQRFGVWDGAEIANTYQAATTLSNWSTCFSFLNGGTRFVDSTNTDVSSYQSGTEYSVSAGDALAIKFKLDGHLELWDLSDVTDVLIAKTITPLASQTFKLQYGSWQYATFPNGSILPSATENWTIVQDTNLLEQGVLNGIKDHTVIQSMIPIKNGEKWMFNLDMNGASQYFGLDWLGSASGVGNAETNVERRFRYDNAEGFTAFQGWTLNTSNPYNQSATLWRPQSGTPVGMCSLRYRDDDFVELWHETSPATLIATTTTAWTGADIYPVFGASGNVSYGNIPEYSKQLIVQGPQPDLTYAPDVVAQTFSVTEAATVNAQLVTNNYIVNQWVETDAPSWLMLNQNTGVFSGTAPAFTGTSADTVVVNCRAGNAVGGVTSFTVTFTILEDAVYTNTKSIKWPTNGSAYLNGNPSNVTSLHRSGNGSGASDAWSLSMWVKTSAEINEQQLFYFGGGDEVNEGTIQITSISGTVALQYGSNNNGLFEVGFATLPSGVWNHLFVSYDGGTTGVNQANLTDYHSRFTMTVNGVNAITQNQHVNYGFAGDIDPAGGVDTYGRFRIGKAANNTTPQNQASGLVLNQFVIWDSDQSSNNAAIYNGGTTQDFTTLTSVSGTMDSSYAIPKHYYEVDTSVTQLVDIMGNQNLNGLNFSTADLVTDAP